MVRQVLVENVTELKERLASYIEHYEKQTLFAEKHALFTGPDLYFHVRTIERVRQSTTPETALADACFFEYLYATMTAWGMDRAGERGPKLSPFDVFRRSAADLFRKLSCYWGRTLVDMLSEAEGEVENTAEKIGSVIASHPGLTPRKTKLVLNSKVAHHFLPDLVPPVDGRYVARFFFGRAEVPSTEEQAKAAFANVFKQYVVVLAHGSNRGVVEAAVERGRTGCGMAAWHTGCSKVLDNAVIGHELAHRGKT